MSKEVIGEGSKFFGRNEASGRTIILVHFLPHVDLYTETVAIGSAVSKASSQRLI